MEEKVYALSTAFLTELYEEWSRNFSSKSHEEFITFIREKYPEEILAKHLLPGDNGVYLDKNVIEEINELNFDESSSILDLKASRLLFNGNGNGFGIYQKDENGSKLPLDMIYATDTRVWNYLSLFVFGKYTIKRWGESNDIRRIFINNLGNEKVSRHSIMRLFWSANICYDKNREKTLELLDVLWQSADFFLQVTERQESNIRTHTQWFLEFCKDPNNNMELFKKKSIEGYDKYRKFMKLYNSQGDIYLYEDTDKVQFNNILKGFLRVC
jgi:hypothetical protein